MHGFCTDFARFQNVQRVLFAAKSDEGCRNFKARNRADSIENDDESEYPEIETNLRLALLISGPRVRVPGGAPQRALSRNAWCFFSCIFQKVKRLPLWGWPSGGSLFLFVTPKMFMSTNKELSETVFRIPKNRTGTMEKFSKKLQIVQEKFLVVRSIRWYHYNGLRR